ncbi:MAG: hypothetical protein ACR2OV_04545, partial [Hyphomicrobiaceae bacterium]
MLEFLDTRSPVCPETLLEKARQSSAKARVAVANAGAPLPMASCKAATEAGLILPVLVGNREDILDEARALGWDVETFEMIEAEGEEGAARAATAAVRD